jgi:flagellar biosynthesis anti-sigma factor FlgM
MTPLNKIGRIVASQTYDNMTPATAKAPAPSAAPVAPAMAAPSVAVSILADLARELSRQEPVVDHAKIAQIRTAIAQGHNNVDAEQIASALARHYSVSVS